MFDDITELDKLFGYKPPPKEPDVSGLLERMRSSVAEQESGDNYNVTPNKRTSATGKFQVLPANIPSWTKTYYGRSLTPEEFQRDPKAQEAVFTGEMGKYLRKAKKKAQDDDTAIRMAAAAWYGGEGAMDRYDDPVRFRPNEPSFREYTSSVLKRQVKPSVNLDALDKLFGYGAVDISATDKLFGIDDNAPIKTTPTVPGLKPLVRPGDPLPPDAPIQTPAQQAQPISADIAELEKLGEAIKTGTEYGKVGAPVQKKPVRQRATAPQGRSEVTIRDDIEFDEQGNVIPPTSNLRQDVVTDLNDAVAVRFDVPQGIKDRDAYVRQELQRRYPQGDFSKFQRLDNLPDATGAAITYGALKDAGIDIAGEEMARQRTERPQVDLSLKNPAPVYTNETKGEDQLRKEFTQEEIDKYTNPASSAFWSRFLFANPLSAIDEAFDPPTQEKINRVVEDRIASLPQTQGGRRQVRSYNYANDDMASYVTRLGTAGFKGFVVDNIAPFMEQAGTIEETARLLLGDDKTVGVGSQLGKAFRDRLEQDLPETTGVPGSDFTRGLGQVGGTILLTLATGGGNLASKTSILSRGGKSLSELGSITKAADDIAENIAKQKLIDPAFFRAGYIGVAQQMSEAKRRAEELGASREQALLAAWLAAPSGFVEGLSELKIVQKLNRIKELDRIAGGTFSQKMWGRIQNAGTQFVERGVDETVEEALQNTSIELGASVYQSRSFQGFKRDIEEALKNSAMAFPIGGIAGNAPAIVQYYALRPAKQQDVDRMTAAESERILAELQQYKGELPDDAEQNIRETISALDAAVERVKQGVRDKFAAPEDVRETVELKQKDIGDGKDQVPVMGGVKAKLKPEIPPAKVESSAVAEVSGDTEVSAFSELGVRPVLGRTAEERGIKVEEGGHLLDQLPSVENVDAAQIRAERFGREIKFDSRNLDLQTTGKLRSDYWLKQIKRGKRPPVIVGVENGQLSTLDGNHRVTAYQRAGISHIPTIFTADAQAQIRGTTTAATDAPTQETKAPSPKQTSRSVDYYAQFRPKGAVVESAKEVKEIPQPDVEPSASSEVKSEVSPDAIESAVRDAGGSITAEGLEKTFPNATWGDISKALLRLDIENRVLASGSPTGLVKDKTWRIPESSASGDVSGEVKPLAPEAQAQIKKWERHASNATDANLHKMAATLESRAESSPSRRARLRIIEAELKRRQTTDNREAWQIPQNEFARGDAQKVLEHKAAVRRAVKRGQTVPPEVLADYPDLAEKTTPARDTRKTQDTVDTAENRDRLSGDDNRRTSTSRRRDGAGDAGLRDNRNIRRRSADAEVGTVNSESSDVADRQRQDSESSGRLTFQQNPNGDLDGSPPRFHVVRVYTARGTELQVRDGSLPEGLQELQVPPGTYSGQDYEQFAKDLASGKASPIAINQQIIDAREAARNVGENKADELTERLKGRIFHHNGTPYQVNLIYRHGRGYRIAANRQNPLTQQWELESGTSFELSDYPELEETTRVATDASTQDTPAPSPASQAREARREARKARRAEKIAQPKVESGVRSDVSGRVQRLAGESDANFDLRKRQAEWRQGQIDFITEKAGGKGWYVAQRPLAKYGDDHRFTKKEYADVEAEYKAKNPYPTAETATVEKDATTQGTQSKDAEPLRSVPQTETDAFARWFGDSKVVDEDGKPLVVYHGTTHDFDTFDPDKANIEGHFGKVIYLTDDPLDLSENYAGEGPDLTSRIEQVAERLLDEKDLKYGTPEYKKAQAEARAMARKQVAGESEGLSMPVYAKIENPLNLTRENPTRFDALESYDEATDEYAENPDSMPMKLYDAMQDIENSGDYYDFDAQKTWDDVTEKIGYDWDGVKAVEVDEALRASEGLMYATDSEGNLASFDIISTLWADGLGFDGIIIDADSQFGPTRKSGKAMVMSKGTKHYHVFQPTQIKSAIGNRGTFDPSDPSILAKSGLTESEHAQLKELTKVQYLDDLFPNIKASNPSKNIVDLSPEAGETIRRALAMAQDTDLEAQALIGGLFTEPQSATDILEALDGFTKAAEKAEVDTKPLRAITTAIKKAAKLDGSVIFDVTGAIEHEQVHYSSWKGADGKKLIDRYANIDEIAKDKDFKRFWGALNDLQGNSSIGVAAEEALAYLGSGDYARFGLTEAQAVGILQKLVTGYAEANGVESLKNFEAEKIYEAIENYRKGESREASNDSRSEVSEGREARSEPSKEKPDKAGEKQRSLPGTLREAGLEAEDESYKVFGNEDAIQAANDLIADLGLEKAIKTVEASTTYDKTHAVMSFMLQRALRNEAAKAEADGQFNYANDLRKRGLELASKHAELATQAGQFTQAAAMVADAVESVLYRAQKIADKRGRPLTPVEYEKFEQLGIKAENQTNDLDRLRKDIRNLKAQLKRLREGKVRVIGTRVNKKAIAEARKSLPEMAALLAQIKKDLRDANEVLRMVAKPPVPQTETEAFKKWFGDSKVVDSNGKPLVVYHGTTHDFDAFDPDRANIENHFGKGIYLTDSPTDVAENYAGEGPDLTQRIEREAEIIFQDLDKDYDYGTPAYDRAMAKARAEAKRKIAGPSEGMTMPVYAKIENPVYIGVDGKTTWIEGGFESFDEPEPEQYDDDFNETQEWIDWDERRTEFEESQYDTESPIIEAIQSASYQYDGIELGQVWEDLRGLEYEGGTADDLDARLRESEGVIYAEDGEGNLASHDFIKEVFRNLGFDGVIMDADQAFGSGRKRGKQMEMDYGTKHYIAFEPTQIKSAIGNRGTFDPNDANILRSVPPDPLRAKLAQYGASTIIDKPLSQINREDFYAEMRRTFGKRVDDILPQIFAESFNLRQELLNDAKMQLASDAMKADDPTLTDAEIKAKIKENAKARKERRAQGNLAKTLAKLYSPTIAKQNQDVLDIVDEIADPAVADYAEMILTKQGPALRKDRQLYKDAMAAIRDAHKILRDEELVIKQNIAGGEQQLRQLEREAFLKRDEQKTNNAAITRSYRRAEEGPIRYYAKEGLKLLGESRSLLASGDLSGSLRQGFYHSLTSPVLNLKGSEKLPSSYMTMLKGLLPKGKGDFTDRIVAIENHPDFDIMKQMGVEFAEAGGGVAEENVRTEYLKHVPVVKNWLGVSERTYAGFLDVQRALWAESVINELRAEGISYRDNPEVYKAAGSLINIATGRGDIGRGKIKAAIESFGGVFFAPRFVVSRVQLLGHVAGGVATLPPGIRKIELKRAARFHTVITLPMLALIAAGIVAIDPDDDDFLKIRVGDKARYEFTGGLQSYIRLIAQIGKAFYQYADGETSAKDLRNTLVRRPVRFLQQKLAPVPSYGMAALTGKEVDTTDFNWLKGITNRLTPITVREIGAGSEDGITGMLLTTPTILGIGTAYYGDGDRRNKKHGGVDNYLKSSEFKSVTTDELVDILMTEDMPESDRDKIKEALKKKARNARKGKTLTQKEVDRIKRVIPDFNITANDKNVKGGRP